MATEIYKEAQFVSGWLGHLEAVRRRLSKGIVLNGDESIQQIRSRMTDALLYLCSIKHKAHEAKNWRAFHIAAVISDLLANGEDGDFEEYPQVFIEGV